MTNHGRWWRVMVAIGIAASMTFAGGGAGAETARPAERATKVKVKKDKRFTHKDRQAAADRAAKKGYALPVAGLATMADPASPPHYFTVPNYANSPLPVFATAAYGNALVARGYPTDLATNVLVVASTDLVDGTLTGVDVWDMAPPSADVAGSGPNAFQALVLRPAATGGWTVVFDSGPLAVPALGSDALQSFAVGPFPVRKGDRLAHFGNGIPLDIGGTPDPSLADVTLYPVAAAPAVGATFAANDPEHPVLDQPRAYSVAAKVEVRVSGLRKFVDTLPGLGAANANNLGNFIPVAEPDTTSYAGSDYYEIGLVQYRQQLHSDLPPTLLRGYVQLSPAPTGNVLANAMPDGTEAPITVNGRPAYGVTKPLYLGPTLVARKDRPVRILFRNLLPSGAGGDLFLPVDTTVMGSGMGPAMGGMAESNPQDPMCGTWPKPSGCFTENRATLHLHGGITPWISDGTPHQWTTPAGEQTPYPQGVSVHDVPDMADPGPGAVTFFYTNQQSARLLFYHDHAWGITRLNVYAGEAAGYVIRDAKEDELLAAGLLPRDEIPLVVQDKTFVPPEDQLAATDPLWDLARWGRPGDLWAPHVYVPAQNPTDPAGVNMFGRWAYGPWFWPPVVPDHGPIPNPYYTDACDPATAVCEPFEIPGVPYRSMGMEAFNDTPLVNGAAYPSLTVDPKTYRFRVLNAANDRFFNLSIYEADASGNEVALDPAEVEAALADPAGVFPTPIANPGPSWIQIGTEGGFLPMPVVIPPQPITWVTDPTVFNAGNVDKHALLLAPAERADVIVDFSRFAGKTLILYNDAPAAFPARDPRYDYYTGNADLTTTGGAPSTLPGYGPNTRTVMQIRVNHVAPAAAYDPAALTAAFAHSSAAPGVFESSQRKIVVGQAAYNAAYGTAFRSSAPRDGFARIHDFQLTFDTVAGQTLTWPLLNKAIQDEQGEAFDRVYGRMSGNLGLETPAAGTGAQNLLLYPYAQPPTEVVDDVKTDVATLGDGTQLWKITHNGVDTHPIHFHLYDVQLVNRVGWDGIVRKPDANELGWKDTIRVSPLEDTIVAVRPVLPALPFEVPNSVRPLDPSMPLGATLANGPADVAAGRNPSAVAPTGDPILVTNVLVNFGLEYVWHCHILSHEEMDMMRPVVLASTPRAPDAFGMTMTGKGKTRAFVLAWRDASINETQFTVERANATDMAFGAIATFASNGAGPQTGKAFTYTDPVGTTTNTYWYRIVAGNTVGDTTNYLAGTTGPTFPTRTLTAATAAATLAPSAPANVAAVVSVTRTSNVDVLVSWTAPSGNPVSDFTAQAATNAAFTTGVKSATVGANVTATTFTRLPRGTTLYFRVRANNDAGSSAWTTATLAVP